MTDKKKILEIRDLLIEVHSFVKEQEQLHEHLIDTLYEHYKKSAINLIHYLALGNFNLAEIQRYLSSLGLASISTSEGYTLSNLENIIRLLNILVRKKATEGLKETQQKVDLLTSRQILSKNIRRMFGESEQVNRTRIMVTMPSEAAHDFNLIKNLLETGMDVARINTSRDDPAVWKAILDNIKKGEAETGRPCLIYMDLGGPRLRTGKVEIRKAKKKKKKKVVDYILLKKGDVLHLHHPPVLGRNAVYFDDGTLEKPASIAVSLPQVFNDVKPGHKIWFDDGTIGGQIIEVSKNVVQVKIIHADIKGSRLRAARGINLPDTYLKLPSLTEEDLKMLPFITKHADFVGYSFVRESEDIELLRQELKKLGREDIGLIVKIENKIAFDNLPDLLLEAMKSPNIGFMIARGDFAVEIGWERLAEAQERILRLCEAAHVPVFIATQVLDNLAKRGIPTRAEITDVAMAARAQCVMLNKGPYILEAMSMINEN